MIDLKKFCHLDLATHRKYLLEPWRCKQGIAASNGHIMIVVPDEGGDYADEVEYMRGVVDRFEQNWIGGGEWIQAQSIALPDAEPCIECGGTGRVCTVVCDECGGEGGFYHKERFYECGKCEGSSRIVIADCFQIPTGADDRVCLGCNGTGDLYQVCKVGNAFAQRKYLAMLADLPDCVVSPDGENGMPFKFTGGHGWLMPCAAG